MARRGGRGGERRLAGKPTESRAGQIARYSGDEEDESAERREG